MTASPRRPRVLSWVLLFAAGIACGGWLFARSTPRSFLAVTDCKARCYKANELMGLFASAAILRAPAVLPNVEMESATCIAIRHPRPEARYHYVLFPKHDSRNITTLTDEDAPFVMGCFAMVRELVARDSMRVWRMLTNGPAMQDVAYLHFHLIGH
jgi:Scavenger mRNA decapping enzyme C-term binding